MTDGQALQVDRALERYKSDLWFTRRLHLREVEENLKTLSHTQDETNDRTVQDYIKFIRFLESECSGRGFSNDKQWGQLMNLMQISRKLNHKSVKFRDILANKSLIEASVREIKQFNESIRIGILIEDLIKNLESGILACQIRMIPRTNTPGYESARVDPGEIDEIFKSQRYFESTLMPLLHDVTLHLQNKLVSRDNPQQYNDWTSHLNKFTSIVDKLKDFLGKYYTLKKDLIQLEPLMCGFSDRNDQQADSTTRANQDNKLVVNSLSECKRDFRIILEYNDSLEKSMKDLARKSLKTSRTAITARRNKAVNDQSETLKLYDLLDRKTLAYVNDIYDSKLSDALETSERCRRTLDQVMSTLRLEFGRFYFVNDLELLTIISLDSRLVQFGEQLSNQRLIYKLFNGSIEKFILKRDESSSQTYIVGVINPVGESIMLADELDPVPLYKKVNIYSLEIVRILNELKRKLQSSLQTILMKSLETQEDIDWSLPIQLLGLAEQIKFTKNVEMSTFDLQKILAHYERRLGSLSDIKQSRTEQSHVDDLKHSEILSLTVHFISTLMELTRRKVSSVEDWQWQKLARYYHCNATGEIRICLANSQFMYKFDLLPIEISSSSAGHQTTIKRLIYTKTSERCFLVASQAIGRLKLGASPFGPAGSGKTETVKAMGQILGCQVIVHNCDETNDARSLERLIWGLAHTGLWGCFDEFNRLSADTLSSVSAVLEIAQDSLRQNRSTLQLEGGQIRSIDQDSAFFITMNPGDSNRYQGRRRLPANLRSLFLPIAMVDVQIDSIVCELLLAHSGTMQNNHQLSLLINAQSAAELGRKLYKWTIWMRSNLQTPRCEWDLRLIMVILKRFKMTQLDDEAASSLDCIVVNSIAAEVVHRLSVDRGEIDILARSFEEIFNHGVGNLLDADVTEAQRKQLKSQLEVRPGVILLDSHSSGRSHRVWRSLVSRDEQIKWFVLNPKSCAKGALFGCFEDVRDAAHGGQIQPTRWIDGLFTHLVRRSMGLLEGEQTHQVCIVLDGSLDPDWIESLNSVLDDNQVLTLSSGERLNFIQPHSKKCIKLIFLADQIEHVSPATISRLGLINLEDAKYADDDEEKHDQETTTGTITKVLVNLGQMETADLIAAVTGIPAGNFDFVEYNCSELSSSNHLFGVLDATRLLRASVKFVLINNLSSIGHEDKWQTKTFVELLMFVVAYGFYYDPEHNISHLPGDIRFILTVTDDNEITDQRLSSMVSEVVDLRDNASHVETVIDRHALISRVATAHKVGIELVYVEVDQLQRLFKMLLESTRSNSTIELFTFDSSASVARSLEKLQNMSRQTHAKIPAPDQKHSVFLCNSLQLSLMNLKSRASLCHLLNLIKFARIGISFFVLLDRCDHSDTEKSSSVSDKFWLSIADNTASLESTTYDESYLRDYFQDEKPDGRLPSILASFSKKHPITDQFLATLKRMIATTRAHVESDRQVLSNSLNRLEQLEKSIEAHKIAKQTEEQDLAEIEAQIGVRFAQMNVELEESKKRSAQIESLKKTQEQKAQQMELNKVNVHKELRNVLPAIEKSKSEVSRCLKPEAMNEIKTLRSPPKTVEDILSVLFVFLGQDATSWSSMKTYLAKHSLRDELTNYDFQVRLTEDTLQKIEHEISKRSESFQPDRASRASTAIVPMLNWIQAARQYGRALIKLRPLTDVIRELETESVSLAKTMKELEDEQALLLKKVAEDKKELDRLDANFKSTKDGLCRLRHDLDRAQEVIGNLGHQLEDWRSRVLECDKLSRNNWQRLYDLCLVCSSVTSYAFNYDSLSQLLRDWSDILGKDEEMNLQDPSSFLRNQLSTIIECVDEESALELRLHALDRNVASANVGQILEQLVKIMLIKLNLHFSQDTIVHLKVDAAMTSAELAQYLASKRILCADQSCLVHIDVTDDNDWQRKADSIMQMGDMLLLLSVSTSSSTSLLDVVDYISTRDSTKLPRKIILVDSSSHQKCSLEMLQLTRVIDIHPHVSAMSDSQMIESKITDYLIELCEPKISSDIRNLEVELSDKQRQVRKLESKLIRSLIVSNTTVQATAAKSELVELLTELRQSGLELGTSIVKITRTLDELRSRRGRFETLARKAAGYYARNLSGLRDIDPFYHMPIEKYAKLVLDSTEASLIGDDIDWSRILTAVMCSMRPSQRDAFRGQLAANESSSTGQEAAVRALKRAANLRSNLSALMDRIATDDNTNPVTCKIAIVQHEATKSGPQLEIDELMRSQTRGAAQKSRLWDYHVLYATKNGPLLQAQLDATLSKQRNDANWCLCVCIANAHLTFKWLSDRLPDMTRTIRSGRLLLILVGESQSVCHPDIGSQSSRARVDIDDTNETHDFGSNLLDAADLRFWYDELALKLLDRFTLYEHRIMSKRKDVTLRDISRQLVLFHVVCQELTKDQADDARTSWQHGSKYNFDYGQLSLAHTILQQIHADNLTSTNSAHQMSPDRVRESFCRYLSSIVYGSRLETQADEELLETLLDKFLRKHDSASCQIATLDKLLSGTGSADSQQQLLVANLVSVSNL